MTESIYHILKKQKRLQEENKTILGSEYINSDFVCTWDNGKIISPNYLTRKFHKIINESSLPKIRLHDLRHSVASNLLNNGFSVVQVAEWLDHSSSATTLNFYAHADKTSKINIANAMENMITFQ